MKEFLTLTLLFKEGVDLSKIPSKAQFMRNKSMQLYYIAYDI